MAYFEIYRSDVHYNASDLKQTALNRFYEALGYSITSPIILAVFISIATDIYLNRYIENSKVKFYTLKLFFSTLYSCPLSILYYSLNYAW